MGLPKAESVKNAAPSGDEAALVRHGCRQTVLPAAGVEHVQSQGRNKVSPDLYIPMKATDRDAVEMVVEEEVR